MKYHLEDTSEDVVWAELPVIYSLERYTAMNDPHGSKPTLYYRNREPAEQAGREHTMSEPWRTHADLKAFYPGRPAGYQVEGWWIHREHGAPFDGAVLVSSLWNHDQREQDK